MMCRSRKFYGVVMAFRRRDVGRVSRTAVSVLSYLSSILAVVAPLRQTSGPSVILSALFPRDSFSRFFRHHPSLFTLFIPRFSRILSARLFHPWTSRILRAFFADITRLFLLRTFLVQFFSYYGSPPAAGHFVLLL